MAKIPYITLSDTINTSRLRINQLIDSVGDLALLTTDDSATIVGAINFLDSNAGRKTALTTTIKTSIVAGINEHDTELGTITAAAMKSRLGASTVSTAIAEIHDSIGSGSLTTTLKTLVGGINEHDAELGIITTSAMKVKGTASTVSGALAAVSDSIGSGPLTTTLKTLVGAINEHDTELGTITTAAMKTKLGAATVSAAIAELNDSIGYGLLNTTSKTLIGAINELQDSIGSGGLTTTTKTLIGAVNEHDAELGTITTAAMKVKGTASTVSGALAAISDSIGSGPLTSVATTLVGAINEQDANAGRKANLSTPIATNLVNAINFLDSNAGRKTNLTTSVKTSLAAAINSVKDSSATVSGSLGALSTPIATNLVNAINFLDSNAGRKTNLSTPITSNFVNAINFLDSNAGRKTNLTTTSKTNLVSAINEHDTELGIITTAAMKTKLGAATVSAAIAELNDSIGYGVLFTTSKTLIGAINELNDSIGVGPLTTTSKILIGAINEHDAELGTITAAAMKTRGAASTVSTAIAQIFDSIGTATLTTTTKTLVGAINEHDAELGTISAAAMKTRGAASTVSTAIAQIFDSIGTALLNTTAKTIAGAINELDLRLDSVEAAIVDSAGQLLLKSNGNLAARFTNSNVQFQGFVSSTTSLSTTQQDYTGAINELKTTIDTITGGVSVDSGITNTVGSLSNLSTTVKSNAVNAINFLDSNAGRKTNLTTTSKTNIVAGVNELKGRLDSINAAGITNTMIKSDAVITSKILNNNVTFAKLPLAATGKRVIASTAAGVIYSEQQVDSDMIGSLAINAAKIQSNAITDVKIVDSAVSTSKIQLNAVTTAKILDLNVTTGKLANNAITFPKMQLSSVANRVIGATSSASQFSEVQINSAMIATGAVDSAALKANVVTLGTKTTGNYVATITTGTGVSFSAGAGTGAGSTPTIAIGQAVGTTSNVTFNDVIISGNLTVSGTTTSVNTETITLNDNIIVLNNNATGVPTENAGIEIERGDSANVLVRWNEATNRWGFTNDGSTYFNLPIASELYDSNRVVSTITAFDKFATTFTYTAGTTAGPTGLLTGANNMAAISFAAIPSAGAAASGIITTGAQTIAGAKTFSSTISGSIDGNAGTATTLVTGRNFSITGVVTAPAISFNGGAAVALSTSFASQSIDSAALGNLSISTVKLQGNVVTNAKIALDTITANRLNATVTLIIYNSAGTALKTLYGAGA